MDRPYPAKLELYARRTAVQTGVLHFGPVLMIGTVLLREIFIAILKRISKAAGEEGGQLKEKRKVAAEKMGEMKANVALR